MDEPVATPSESPSTSPAESTVGRRLARREIVRGRRWLAWIPVLLWGQVLVSGLWMLACALEPAWLSHRTAPAAVEITFILGSLATAFWGLRRWRERPVLVVDVCLVIVVAGTVVALAVGEREPIPVTGLLIWMLLRAVAARTERLARRYPDHPFGRRIAAAAGDIEPRRQAARRPAGSASPDDSIGPTGGSTT